MSKPKSNFKSGMEVMADLQGFFKPGERRAIYNACTKYRDRVLIRLLWKSGRRVSEVIQIKVEDIDFENRNILWAILKKKRKHKRWKPIDNFTLRLLAYYIDTAQLKNEHYLIHGGYPEKHITRQRVFDIVRRLCKKAKIDHVGGKKPHPHHFRHTFAIDLAKRTKSAADIRKVQMMMEHSNLSMTEQYLQFGSVDLRSMIDENEDPND